jgi:hypothetical protein
MPAGSTYTPIATTTLGSAQATVTFSSISGSYTDLVLVESPIFSTGSQSLLRVGNGSVDTGANYSSTNLSGNGSSAQSARYTGLDSIGTTPGTTQSTAAHTVIRNIQNYSNTTTFKTVLQRVSGDSVWALVGLWRSTAAINIITLTSLNGNYQTGSTFTLYGIAAA